MPLAVHHGHRRRGLALYTTQKLVALLQRPARSTLATRTSTVTSLLFLATILAVGAASLASFRTQLLNVMIAEQNTLLEPVADKLDQKLLVLPSVLLLSTIAVA